jgi:mono/diheme cytochrome c family protein
LPDPTPQQEGGRALFETNCAVCHGENAAGSDQGPTLVHRIYEPSHHGDMAIMLAARQGVRAHHWLFGNTPAV